MEIITIVLSSLLTLISPVGLVADEVAEGLIRDRLYAAESLQVRIDNVPNFRLLEGHVDRIRIAGRGLYPVPELRIEMLDVETDPIDVNLADLRAGDIRLQAPIRAAAHVVLNVEDLNQLLRSPLVQERLEDLRISLPGDRSRERNRYSLANPQIEFLADQRLRITLDFVDQVQAVQVEARIESGIEIVAGHQLVLSEPRVTIDGQPVPQLFVNTLIRGVGARLTLKQLEPLGITARILQLSLQPDGADAAVFVQVTPTSPLLEN